MEKTRAPPPAAKRSQKCWRTHGWTGSIWKKRRGSKGCATHQLVTKPNWSSWLVTCATHAPGKITAATQKSPNWNLENHLNQSSMFGFQPSIFQSVISNIGEAALGWLGWKKHGVETGPALKFHYVRRAKNVETLPNVSRNHRISTTLLIPNLAALGGRLEPSGLQDIQTPTRNKQNCWSELLWKCTHLQAMVNW